ncbi:MULTISPECIES: hypothetical protein [Anaerorhabdus]|uniref:Uncharacterized protein n=1 Tax=Anaerorhabdus furcosa TaxID=118967 RepID=A0A1T4M2R2_9FIRM|nr:hypothetical protein [Anaerorhabdus furcosa]SJZ61175.1 hypothetical protein SAMN02745191_1155 [Anaerorhabdus furcosa]
MYVFLYCLSVSLQITGALLVADISFNSLKRENVLKKFLKTNIVTFDSFKNKLIYDREAFKEFVMNKALLFISLIFIISGFMLGIFYLNDGLYLFVKTILVILITVFLIFIAKMIVGLILSKTKICKELTIEELDRYNLPVHGRTISIEEIEEIFK